MTTKPILLLSLILNAAIAWGQTSIDQLQAESMKFLADQESQGYEFQQQVVSDFSGARSTQKAQIQLSKSDQYLIVAIGDHKVPEIDLLIKPRKGVEMQLQTIGPNVVGKAILLTASRPGPLKISIKTSGLDTDTKGFVNFMILRKPKAKP